VMIVEGPTATLVSTTAGTRITTFSFKANEALQEWKVKAVPSSSSPHTAGTVVPTTFGSQNTTGTTLPIDTAQEVVIDARDASVAANGGTQTIIRVYARDIFGTWSIV
jgi:hypothetical protein